MSRQGKVRLAKWYYPYDKKQQQTIVREVCAKVLKRRSKLCNFLEWKDGKIIYRRYASLFFVTYVDNDTNELQQLNIIHHYVEALDRYFGDVCELDLIFNFHRAYYILDELLLGMLCLSCLLRLPVLWYILLLFMPLCYCPSSSFVSFLSSYFSW